MLRRTTAGTTDQLQQVNVLNYKNTICSQNSSVSTLFYFCNRSDVYVVFYLGLTPFTYKINHKYIQLCALKSGYVSSCQLYLKFIYGVRKIE